MQGTYNDAGRVEVVFYTDPLCCWSWAFEPHWQKLKETLGDKLGIRYCMGGMLESWTNYNDPFNSVTKPIQMGPLWMQASHMSGVEMNSAVWVKDPPASSYLACVAVKCAFLQSPEVGERYLYAIRHALMHEGVNIAKQSALVAIATTFAKEEPAFDLTRFKEDLVSGNGMDAFNADLQEVRYRNISRFPTLVMSYKGKAVVLTGYRKYEAVMETVKGLGVDAGEQGAGKRTA